MRAALVSSLIVTAAVLLVALGAKLARTLDANTTAGPTAAELATLEYLRTRDYQCEIVDLARDDFRCRWVRRP